MFNRTHDKGQNILVWQGSIYNSFQAYDTVDPIPAELNIRFAVTLNNLSRNVEKNDFSIALQGMLLQAICPMQLAMAIV